MQIQKKIGLLKRDEKGPTKRTMYNPHILTSLSAYVNPFSVSI